MALSDYPNGTSLHHRLLLIAILLVAGWFGVRRRVADIHRTAPVTQDSTESALVAERRSSIDNILPRSPPCASQPGLMRVAANNRIAPNA